MAIRRRKGKKKIVTAEEQQRRQPKPTRFQDLSGRIIPQFLTKAKGKKPYEKLSAITPEALEAIGKISPDERQHIEGKILLEKQAEELKAAKPKEAIKETPREKRSLLKQLIFGPEAPEGTKILKGAPLLGTGGVLGAGAAVGRGGTAVITRQATIINTGRSLTTQRAFIGRPATSGIDKIFHAVRPVATKFANNTKSKTLSMSFLSKLGLSIGAAGLFVTAVGTYPFAGFIKEEASQTTGIGFFQAERNNDLEGMQEAITQQEELLNNEKNILDKIPFLNVQKQLRAYFDSVRVKLESDKRIFAQRVKELEGGN